MPRREAVEFYKHAHGWSNRLVAGDSLLVMNSLLEKEGLAGKVQMVYLDPPYGIRYGSNFQPFLDQRDVKDRIEVYRGTVSLPFEGGDHKRVRRQDRRRPRHREPQDHSRWHDAGAAHRRYPAIAIAELCRRHRIRRLALFGSVLRDDFTPESDIDVLVEFEPGHDTRASPSAQMRG